MGKEEERRRQKIVIAFLCWKHPYPLLNFRPTVEIKRNADRKDNSKSHPLNYQTWHLRLDLYGVELAGSTS